VHGKTTPVRAIPTRVEAQVINWVWTLNNYTPAELVNLKTLCLTNKAKYIIWGEEVGEQGTAHLQGYIELTKRCRLSGLKKILPSRAHCEPRRGSQAQAIKYCQKDGKWVEFGTPTIQAGMSLPEKENLIQNQLIELRETIRQGVSEKDIYETYPLMAARYPKFIARTIEWETPPIREDLKIELHVGETGCGKTHYAFKRYPALYNIPIQSGKSLWFNGYNGHKVVLIDDFKGAFKLDQLLRLLDKYPVQVEVKGAMVWWTPDLIILTSNFREETWYDWQGREEHLKALKRRINTRYQWTHRQYLPSDLDWQPLALIPTSVDKPADIPIIDLEASAAIDEWLEEKEAPGKPSSLWKNPGEATNFGIWQANARASIAANPPQYEAQVLSDSDDDMQFAEVEDILEQWGLHQHNTEMLERLELNDQDSDTY